MVRAGRVFNRLLIAVLIAAGLAACGGGGGSAAAPNSPALPAASSTPVAAKTPQTARVTITVPSAATAASSSRNPAFVSPATQSVIITLSAVDGKPYTGSPASFAANLTQGSANCSGTPLVCTIAVAAVTGTDTFTISTFDALQPITSLPSTPAGNLLSQATIDAAIAVNATNTVQIILSGVPATLAIGSLPVITGGTPLTPQAFHVSVKDAAGNIVLGTYATPITISTSDTSGAIALSKSSAAPSSNARNVASVQSQTLSSSGDTAYIAYSGLAIAPATITLQAGGVTTSTTVAPALNPIVLDQTAVSLSASTPTVTVTGSEIGWTNAPFNKPLGFALDPSCSTIATASSTDNLTFTLTAVPSPIAGSCTAQVTDFASGQSATVSIAYASSGNMTFNYTGGEQTFVVPAGITSLTIDSYGAQGGGGGAGGETQANVIVMPGETLYIEVGQYGGSRYGAFNGGGSATDGCNSSGGGASDVRRGGNALVNRIVVAGGGGGGGCDQSHGGGGGGAGGNAVGGDGVATNSGGFGGFGGTQTSGGLGGGGGPGDYIGLPGASGALGQGGNGGLSGGDGVAAYTALGGAGGGGGYYGGGGGGGGGGENSCCTQGGGGGAGGSSYNDPAATNVIMNAGVQGGDGSVYVQWPAYILPSARARKPALHALIRH
jgi:hypothetical protein